MQFFLSPQPMRKKKKWVSQAQRCRENWSNLRERKAYHHISWRNNLNLSKSKLTQWTENYNSLAKTIYFTFKVTCKTGNFLKFNHSAKHKVRFLKEHSSGTHSLHPARHINNPFLPFTPHSKGSRAWTFSPRAWRRAARTTSRSAAPPTGSSRCTATWRAREADGRYVFTCWCSPDSLPWIYVTLFVCNTCLFVRIFQTVRIRLMLVYIYLFYQLHQTEGAPGTIK